MNLKILNIEDDIIKHSSIQRAITSEISADIDLASDMASGLEMIDNACQSGVPYDLVISDMHYPLSIGSKPDSDAGSKFIEIASTKYSDLPIIICSSLNFKIAGAFGCVWYSDRSDWEREIVDMIKKSRNRVSFTYTELAQRTT